MARFRDLPLTASVTSSERSSVSLILRRRSVHQDMLAGPVGILLVGFLKCLDQIAVLAAEVQLGVDAERRRDDHALDQPLGVGVRNGRRHDYGGSFRRCPTGY